MGLVKRAAEAWPSDCGWLVPEQNCTPLQYAVCLRAMKDVGILEVPLGSNRGTRIDRYAKRGGSPVGSWWCALFVGAVFADAGALVPENYGLTDNWLPYIDNKPAIGAAVLYGLKKKGPVRADMDSHHIGIIVRLDPMVLSVEGNRGFAGSTNNGVAVDLGPVLRSDILGYFHPRLA
jgi:hypothetical protein